MQRPAMRARHHLQIAGALLAWLVAGVPAEFARAADADDDPADFSGVWESTYGRMRLVQDGARVDGIYAYSAGSFIAGEVAGDRLEFEYREPSEAGEGWFEISEDGAQLNGRWRVAGAAEWSEWTAQRVEAQPDLRYLVVLEANWESSLAEQEYSFGEMLRSFFARTPQVQTRHRFFHDQADFDRFAREVAMLAEPVVLLVATHGTAEGIPSGGELIDAQEMAAALGYADNVQLLHFSACSMLQDGLAAELAKHLAAASFPISGYGVTVDWAGSALVEFTYLDLILSRGFAPAEAAAAVPKLLTFAAGDGDANAAIPPCDFRFFEPKSPGIRARLPQQAEAAAE